MQLSPSDIRIFAGSSSTGFVAGMCRQLGIEPGRSETFHFSEGNSYVKILESVRGKDIYLAQTIGFDANDAFMELLFWIDAFKRASASSITVIMPYFGYAKADKKDEPRVSIRARVCADCIEAAGADRVVAMDLHSPQIQGFFKIPLDHLLAHPIICEWLKNQSLGDFVIVSPDAGFAKSAQRYAAYLSAPIVICDKMRRLHDERAEILEVIGDVSGKTAIIVDDFAISCGTLAATAEALVKRGAVSVSAAVTHALITREGLGTLNASRIERLIVTDTVDNPRLRGEPKVTSLSVAPLFGEAVRIIHGRESLSEIFDAPFRTLPSMRAEPPGPEPDRRASG
ncbi:MAG TPA: ribose-phosphate pyrophosphokinase [Rectinemataceae bacterium]|nr:ribose-phosphate pyrophosphokinase [Rectinemataceae bacterium]